MKKTALSVLTGLFACCLLSFCGCRRVSDMISADELEKRYDSIIAAKAQSYDLEPELIKAVIWKESRFHEDQIGGKGELGLMQLLKPAIKDWAQSTHHDIPSDKEVMDPELNIEIGTWYLAWCGKRFPDRPSENYLLLLAIYNAGYGRVRDNWLSKDPKKPFTFQDIGYPSTKDYISKIQERMALYKEQRNF